MALSASLQLDPAHTLADPDLDWAVQHVVNLRDDLVTWHSQQRALWDRLHERLAPLAAAAQAMMPEHVRRCSASRYLNAWILLVLGFGLARIQTS